MYKCDNLSDNKYNSFSNPHACKVRLQITWEYYYYCCYYRHCYYWEDYSKRENSGRVVSIWFATKVRVGCDFHGKSFDSNLSSANGKWSGIMA